MRSAKILQGICEDLLGSVKYALQIMLTLCPAAEDGDVFYVRSSAAEDGDVYTSEVSEIQSVISSDQYKEMALRHLKKISNTFEKD